MPRALPRRLAALALAGATLAGLTACATADPAPEPTPTTDVAEPPLFDSDEEALAAAVEAYEAYSVTSTAVGYEGGAQPERLSDLVTPDLYSQVEAEFEALHDAGLHIEGAATVSGGELAQYSPEQSPIVSVYFCRDISATRVVDSDGNDVTPEGRQIVQPILAHFEAGEPRQLLVSEIERWSDDSFC